MALKKDILDMKYDGGKIRASLPFIDFPYGLQQLVGVADMGARKYEPHSWRTIENAEERYKDAIARHFLASFDDPVDEESGLDHLAHMAWNCLALMEFKKEREDDVE